MVYKRLQWGLEPVSSQKLNDMVANDDWLFQNQVTGFYDALGIVRDSGLEFRTGLVKAQATNAGSFFVSNYYSRPFLPGARPIVLVSFMSGGPMLVHLSVRGLDNQAIPDHRGFLCHFSQLKAKSTDPTKFKGEQYAAYIAIAPRS